MKPHVIGRAVRCFAVALASAVLVALAAATGAAGSIGAPQPPGPPPNGTVQVTNAETGAPVLGARIRFFRQDDGRTAAQIVTDRDGVASARLESGDYRYVVSKPGFQQLRGTVSLELHGESVWTINVLLTPGITPITEDVSLCSDMLDPYQTATTYVVCNGP